MKQPLQNKDKWHEVPILTGIMISEDKICDVLMGKAPWVQYVSRVLETKTSKETIIQ